MSPFPAENYQHNCLYLWSVGIVPPHPKPSEQQRRTEQRTRLPDALEGSHKGTVSPTEAFVLDTPCVRAEFHFVREEKKGQRETRLEKLWLDPQRDFAPLQWETWIDGRLQTRRTYTDFEEPAPGCWLPNKIVLGEGTPAWVAPRYKNKVAFDYVLQVRKVRVNDVPGAVFDAASLRNPSRK